jgi:hypothetical protein
MLITFTGRLRGVLKSLRSIYACVANLNHEYGMRDYPRYVPGIPVSAWLGPKGRKTNDHHICKRK